MLKKTEAVNIQNAIQDTNTLWNDKYLDLVLR